MGLPVWIIALLALALTAHAQIPTECKDDQECLIELPGATCADGTPSFMTLTQRKNAKHLLVYLQGGGACWNKDSCQAGYAKNLTRREVPTDWNSGKGVFNASDKANPFREGYNIITIPYCTGDAYTGARTPNYGSSESAYEVRHQGYGNVKLALAAARARLPHPEKAVLLGCSAGGIGAYYQLRNFAETFPESEKFVISDAGTPFRPPYLHEANYRTIMKNWGADTTLSVQGGETVENFSELIRYNTRRFADIRFGFISSYRDTVMGFFALSVGSPSPFSAVKSTIIDLADEYIGRNTPNAKVFYTDSSRHCHTVVNLSEISSEREHLGDWLTALVEKTSGWDNVRPDLNRPVREHSDSEANFTLGDWRAYQY